MLVLALALLLASSPQARQKPDPVGAGLIACAPPGYDAALACLDKHLTADSKAKLRKDGAALAHFGIGMFIRNNWGLWRGGPLQTAMKRAGFKHPDDMSSAILDGYVAKLHGERFDIAAQAAKYRSYWDQTKARGK